MNIKMHLGTCPNIDVEIDMTDKIPFFIRPFHARDEDKAILDKEVKRLLFGYPKRRILSLFKPSYVCQQENYTRQKSCDKF